MTTEKQALSQLGRSASAGGVGMMMTAGHCFSVLDISYGILVMRFGRLCVDGVKKTKTNCEQQKRGGKTVHGGSGVLY